MSLTSTITIQALSTLSSALDLASATVPLSYTKTYSLTSGTGANQANQIFHDQRTLSASANEDLDLAGSLTNALGATITLTKLKAIIIVASSSNTNNVEVTRPASNGVPMFLAASDGVSLTPGASFCMVWPDANGITVTASTGDLIHVANSSGSTSVTYDVIVIGVA